MCRDFARPVPKSFGVPPPGAHVSLSPCAPYACNVPCGAGLVALLQCRHRDKVGKKASTLRKSIAGDASLLPDNNQPGAKDLTEWCERYDIPLEMLPVLSELGVESVSAPAARFSACACVCACLCVFGAGTGIRGGGGG